MENFKLDNKKISSGFTVPEKYFDNFSDEVLNKIRQENELKVVSLWSNHKYKFISIAASVIVFIALTFIVVNNQNTITNTEIEDYLTYTANISDADIAELIDDENIENIAPLNLENQTDIENEILNSNIEQIITN